MDVMIVRGLVRSLAAQHKCLPDTRGPTKKNECLPDTRGPTKKNECLPDTRGPTKKNESLRLEYQLLVVIVVVEYML